MNQLLNEETKMGPLPLCENKTTSGRGFHLYGTALVIK